MERKALALVIDKSTSRRPPSRKSSPYVDARNSQYDASMKRVEATAVNQVADLAFYKRGPRWVDARLLTGAPAQCAGGQTLSLPPAQCAGGQTLPLPPAARTVIPGTPESLALLERLARDGRQGVFALSGEKLLLVDGEPIVVTER